MCCDSVCIDRAFRQGLRKWIAKFHIAWIIFNYKKAGCGNEEYICAEKGATFSSENPPSECPDLSKESYLNLGSDDIAADTSVILTTLEFMLNK